MSYLSLPNQNIPEGKKDKNWHISHATGYAEFSQTNAENDRKQEIEKLYRGYFAELDEKEQQLVNATVCPNGVNLGIQYIVYPLIQSKVEQIVGEYMSRPLRRKAYVLDKKSVNAKLDKKLDMLTEKYMRQMKEELQEEFGFEIETSGQDQEIPDDVEEFMKSKFKMIAERVADDIVTLFLDVNKGKNRLPELFIDYCIADETHAVIDRVKGHTVARKVHPLDSDYDIDPLQAVQKDHEVFAENLWLTKNEIFNTFHDLTEDEKKAITAIFEMYDAGNDTNSSRHLATTKKYGAWIDTNNKPTRMRVVNMMWKSQKKVSLKVAKNKHTEKEVYKQLTKKRKARADEKVKNIIGEVPRCVQMLGPDICLKWGEMDERYSSVEDPYNCFLPVVSIVRDVHTGSTQKKSVAAKLYQLQQLASEILFEIRLAVKHMGDSRVLIYDVAQTPKDFAGKGFDSAIDRVMHHIKKDKLMFINSKDRKAQKAGFNQFNSLDLSQKQIIQDMFLALGMIEDLASKFVGITPEREGQVGQYQTAGGTNAAIQGSNARTEVIYTPFDEFVQVLLERVIMKAKKDYAEGEVIQLILGDFEHQFLKMYKDFFESDLGIYLSDSRKDKEKAMRIDAAAEQALSSSNDMEMVGALIDLLEADTAVEKKAIFNRAMGNLAKLREENRKMQEAAMKAEAEEKQNERDLKERIGDKRNDSQENIAHIYADNKAITENLKHESSEKIKAAELMQKDREKSKSSDKKPQTSDN